jgi:hypothetical protein
MFNKIVEFFTGKKPEAAPAAPYKVEVTPVVEAAPAPAIVPDTVIITSDAVAPTLVVDTIVTEPTQPEVSAPKPAAKRGAAKVTTKPKAPAKAPQKPRSKKV